MLKRLPVILWLAVINTEVGADFRGNNVKGQLEVSIKGSSGTLCGKFKCVELAVCYLLSCQCPPGMTGDGRIACFPITSFTAQIVGDPIMTTFDKERVHLPLPCRYKLTHFITPHYMGASGGTCEIQIYGLNYFTKGGYYVMGFDLLVKITDDERPGHPGAISLRKFGLEVDGRWKYLVQGKKTINHLTPWGPPTVLTYMDTHINSTFDEIHNFAEVKVKECGFDLRFRAFVRRSQQLPGLAVAVDNRPGLVFIRDKDMLCSSPFHLTKSYLGRLKRRLKLKKSEAILFLAFNQDTQQDFGIGAVPCNVAGKQFLRVCTTTREKAFALKMCSFVYENKHTADCLLSDEFGESTGSIFGMCVQALCTEHTKLCNDVKDELSLYQCPIPEPFASLDCYQLRETKLTIYPEELD